jgi:hypothetical protein
VNHRRWSRAHVIIVAVVALSACVPLSGCVSNAAIAPEAISVFDVPAASGMDAMSGLADLVLFFLLIAVGIGLAVAAVLPGNDLIPVIGVTGLLVGIMLIAIN